MKNTIENTINHIMFYQGKIIGNQELKQMLDEHKFKDKVEIFYLNKQRYEMN